MCLTIATLIFGRSDLYVSILGFVALGLESTLPIPQLIRYLHSSSHVVSFWFTVRLSLPVITSRSHSMASVLRFS